MIDIEMPSDLITWAHSKGYLVERSASDASDISDVTGDNGFHLTLKVDLLVAKAIVGTCYSLAAHGGEIAKIGSISATLFFRRGDPLLRLTVSDASSPAEAEHMIMEVLDLANLAMWRGSET